MIASLAQGRLAAPSATPGRAAFGWLKRLFRTTQAQIGGAIILLLLFTAAFAPLVAPHDPFELRVGPPKAPPSTEFPFGTDDVGRDMLSRPTRLN